MYLLQQHSKQILKTGYEILFELEKETPDLERVKNLYNVRSESIEKLDRIPPEKIDNLSKDEQKKARNLFTRLELLEKKLNRSLASWAEIKKQGLDNLGLHKKAKSSYNKDAVEPTLGKRQIVDLTSGS